MPVPSNPVPVSPDDQAIHDSFVQYGQQLDAKQNSVLQASIAAAAQKNPDLTAEAQRLGLQVGVGSDIASRNMDIVRKMALVQNVGDQNLPQTAPRLAKMLEDPNFSGVAYDDLNNLTKIEQGAQQLRASEPQGGNRAWAEAQSAVGNINAAVIGAFKPFVDAAGAAVETGLKTPGALLDATVSGRDPEFDELKDLYLHKQTWAVQQYLTDPVQKALTQGVISGPSQYTVDPATGGYVKNPAYSQYGRPLVNSLEQVPGMLAAFALTGKAGGAAGEAAGADEATAAAVERQTVPAILGTQSAQNTYAEARAKGADQKMAVMAALSAGLTNYAFMAKMPEPVQTSTIGGALGQWAGRSAAFGTGMAVTGNAIARGYDPDRGLLDDIPQSIATMAAFEGAGAVGQFGEPMEYQRTVNDMIDAAQASKLRGRAPDVFHQAMDAQFEGDSSFKIPAQDFVNYFAGKKLDPALMANQVGVTNLDEAAAAGSDLEIPKANFFARLDPEHAKGLLPDLVDPSTDLTARQAEAGKTELQDWMKNGGVEKLQAEFAQADAETQATPEWKAVHDDLKQRYVNAGETEPAAESYATLHANAIASLATRAGLKPDELLALRNPNITEGEAPGALYQSSPERPELTGDEKQALTKIPKNGWRNSESLLEYRDELKGLLDKGYVESRRNDEWGTDFRRAKAPATAEVTRQPQSDNERQMSLVRSEEALQPERLGSDLAVAPQGEPLEIDVELPKDRPINAMFWPEGSASENFRMSGVEREIKESKRDLAQMAGSSADLSEMLREAEAKADILERGARKARYGDPNGTGRAQVAAEVVRRLRNMIEAQRASVIDTPRLREAAPAPVMEELGRSADAINSFAKRPDEWNLLPAIRAAVAKLGGVEHEGEPDNPVVDTLAQHLEGEPGTAKKALEKYARIADKEKPAWAGILAPDAFDAFNHSFGTKLTAEEFHDGLEKAAQRENTAGDADLSGTAAGDEGAGREQSGVAAGPGGNGPGIEPEPGSRPGAGGERHAADERPADDVASGKRGWFRMLPDGRYEIGKTKIGDFSTFLHEPAHAYLEMFRELTQREGASDALKDDFKKICDWLGTTPEEAQKNGFTREQHEQWARANEAYAREGNAPTSGLKRAFHNFAVWLGSIYRRAGALGVELSPEIRGVMDRLYAGDDAVNRAEQTAPQQAFSNPEEAGWTEEQYKNYAESKGLEATEAKTQLIKEMHEAWLREKTQAWREEKGNVRDAVTQEIDARPEYTAIRSLRKGKLADGTDLSLNRDALISQFGEDRVKALQKLHPGLYRQEGGTDAETAAELLGFGSGEEMMRALEGAPRRAQAIEAATHGFMTAKHGDIRYDGSLDDKARLAMENDERAKNLHGELAALKRKVASLQKSAADAKAAMRSIAIEPLENYQAAAKAMIDGKAIADLQPNRYLTASRMFSREAFDAVRRGDAAKAADAKNKELLNHFLYREAMAARDYADKFESYAKRMQSRGIQQRLGLADVQSGKDYRDQFNWLLARYRLGPAAQAPERSLRAWAEDVYGQGNEPAIAPGILNENKFADYRNVPLSEVRDLHDALINVRHLAMQEFKMYVQGKQVDFAEAKSSMMASARENLKVKPEKIFDENRSAADRVADVAGRADAMLVRMERMMEWLDGGKTGPWHDNVFNLASDAQGDEYTMQHQVTRAVTDALADMPDEMRRRLWTEKVSVEGVTEPLTRRRMLSIAFNMGNEGNLDRLRKTFDSFGWDRGAIEKIGGMLTHEEWSFVQKAWDSLKPLGVRMQELEKRLTGLPPAMVKVTPFKVALDDGTEMDLAGGYYPIKMDPRFSDKGMQQEAKETAQNAMQSGYVRATTSKGYTKERTGFGGPLDLDYERVLTDHVSKVAKDLSHREFMLSSQRLLLDTEVRKTLRETLGPAYEEQFMPWLRTIINDRNGSVQQGLGDLSHAMQTLRSNIVAASIGFKVSTALLQITHVPRMMLYAKPGSIAQSLADFLARPGEMTRENQALSPNEMRFRGDNLDRDVRAVLREPSYKAGFAKTAAQAARWTLATVDHLVSHTLWRAAYRDGLAKYVDLSESEAQSKAVHEADSAVRLGLGTQAPKDLPAIMRNGDFNKMITTLYGFHNGVYNQLRDNAHQFRYGGGAAKLTYATILTAIAPALLGALVTGDGPKDGENLGLWAAKRATLFSADTVPLLSSVAQFMAKGRDMQFTPIENVMQKGAKAAMEATSSKEDKDWMGIGLDSFEAGGALYGLPGSGQITKTTRYIKRAGEGKVENPNWWNAIAGGGYR